VLLTPRRLDSGGDCFQGLILDGLVHEPTDRFSTFDNTSQRSYESSNIVDGIIVVTTTSESNGGGVIFESNVLDSGRTRDSELHDESVNQCVYSLSVFRAHLILLSNNQAAKVRAPSRISTQAFGYFSEYLSRASSAFS